MQTNVSKEPHAVIWIVAIVVIAFGVVSMGAMMGWLPTSMSVR
jgi:hypothetical protein